MCVKCMNMLSSRKSILCTFKDVRFPFVYFLIRWIQTRREIKWKESWSLEIRDSSSYFERLIDPETTLKFSSTSFSDSPKDTLWSITMSKKTMKPDCLSFLSSSLVMTFRSKKWEVEDPEKSVLVTQELKSNFEGALHSWFCFTLLHKSSIDKILQHLIPLAIILNSRRKIL